MGGKKWTVYSSIKELKMNRFVACSVHHQYDQLIKSGEPSPEDIANAWIDILDQYQNERTGDHNDNLEAHNDIAAFELTKAVVLSCVFWIRLKRSQWAIDELQNEYGYDYEFEEHWERECNLVEADIKSQQIYIEELKAELGDDVSVRTEQDYYKTFTLIQKELGVLPNHTPMRLAQELSVFEYIMYLNQYDEIAAANNKTTLPDGDD